MIETTDVVKWVFFACIPSSQSAWIFGNVIALLTRKGKGYILSTQFQAESTVSSIYLVCTEYTHRQIGTSSFSQTDLT